MVEPIFYLIALFICFTYPTGMEPLVLIEQGDMAVLLSSIGLLMVYVLVCLVLYLTTKDLKRVYKIRFFMRFVGLLVFALVIYVCNFIFLLDKVFKSLSFPNSVVLKGIIYLLPFFLISGVNTFTVMFREAKESGQKIGDMIEFSSRMFLGLVMIPILIMLGFVEMFEQIQELEKIAVVYPIIGALLLLVVVGLTMLFSPYIVKLSFSGKSIEDGPFKETILALCRKAKLRCRDIIVVNTKSTFIVNAFVTGLVPGIRFIFITRHLLNNMTEREIESVVSHEISHVTRKHMLAYMGMMIGFIAFSMLMHELLFMATGQEIPPWFTITIFLFFWLFVFSSVSKRFESEADICGARLIESYDDAIMTLDRVAELNRVPKQNPSLRHFSIEKRNLILAMCSKFPEFASSFLDMSKTIKNLIRTTTIASFLYFVFSGFVQFQFPSQNMANYNGMVMLRESKELITQEKFGQAKEIIKKAMNMGMRGPASYYLMGLACLGQGERLEARDHLIEAIKKGLQDPYERLEAKRLLQSIQ